MLSKYKAVRPKKRRKRPFAKCFHVCGIFRIFFSEGAPNFLIFSSVFFPEELFSSILRIKKAEKGSGGVLPRKIF